MYAYYVSLWMLIFSFINIIILIEILIILIISLSDRDGRPKPPLPAHRPPQPPAGTMSLSMEPLAGAFHWIFNHHAAIHTTNRRHIQRKSLHTFHTIYVNAIYTFMVIHIYIYIYIYAIHIWFLSGKIIYWLMLEAYIHIYIYIYISYTFWCWPCRR